MKKGWEKRFDKMWYSPTSTFMNWEGLFKRRSFFEQLFEIEEWRDSIEVSLKKELANLIKDFIKHEL